MQQKVPADMVATIPILIYDGACPMCQRARQWIEARVPRTALQTMACQDDARATVAPMVSFASCMEAMQLVMPDGTVYAGDRAFPHLLRMTPNGRYFSWLFQLPGTNLIYRLIARNRLALSGLLIRKKKGAQCSIDDGCE